MVFRQHELRLPGLPRGCHLVTQHILQEIGPSLQGISVGLCHVFIKHTSASLTLNENADPDVRGAHGRAWALAADATQIYVAGMTQTMQVDMETFLSKTVPEGPRAPWVHTDEGHDDMPAHVKSSMLGASVTIPITSGRLNLGTWQGIWMCEHRNHGGSRRLVVTIQGE